MKTCKICKQSAMVGLAEVAKQVMDLLAVPA